MLRFELYSSAQKLGTERCGYYGAKCGGRLTVVRLFSFVEICSWKRALAPCLIDGFSAAKEAAFSWGGWGFHSTL
jgi:hypothetical protein